MKTKDHIRGFAEFGIIIFLWSLIVTAIVWSINYVIAFIKMCWHNRKPMSEAEEERELKEANEYFKIHGKQCPYCGNYVPNLLRCCVCQRVIVTEISEKTRKELEAL